jgi:3-deoxy-D-manno-octulosonate 8-phosphate phosphatase (KDO 8-P phosphatase)
MNSAQVATTFAELGGTFVARPGEFARSLEQVKALLFDWDGVFNSGSKGHGAASGFSEADSMGTNMLRFGLWRRANSLPVTVIITGESNPTATEFARREHFDAVYMGVRGKQQVIRHLLEERNLEPDNLAWIFDDINDLAVAAECALRVLVRRPASPLMRQYVIDRDLVDYITAHDAADHGVRETCELMLGLLGEFENVVQSRTAVDEAYETYFEARQQVITQVFVEQKGAIVPR